MAAVQSQEASSTASRCAYDVFLNFRGKDTRKNFTDHLYTALCQGGFHTFRDDDEIERGENIELEIQKAIQESKISIIVFSRDYASSRWCLDELVLMMESKKLFGHHVLPVFYDVDPSQVRKQTGSFAEAFVGHEKHFKEEKGRVEGWRAALREVADLGGMELQDGYESQFIQNIVKVVGNIVSRTVLNVDSILVGIESSVEHINLWLHDGLDDVGIASIYGMGGIGKTTIAKIVYNMNFNRFEGSSFLANVREMSKQHNGLVHMQRKLLSDLSKRKPDKIYSVDEGIIKIKDVVCCKRVLLILDDVDQLDQFNAIIGMKKWFNPGSKIIITTRHGHLLRAYEGNLMFKIEELDDNESLQLFSWHAFGQDHPMHGFEKHSKNVVHHCGGLPLALKVLGKSLFGKTADKWESTLQKLEKIANNEIQKILRISYDSLEDDHDKSLFLDIACLFIGMDMAYAIRILDGCNFYTTIGIQNLVDRGLITITYRNKLMMHQLIRDMGREIVRQETQDSPGKRSRLWDNKDALAVLSENTGTESIRGFSLNLSMLMEDKEVMTIATANYAKQIHNEDSTSKLMLPHLGNCSKKHHFNLFYRQPVNNAPINSLSTKAFSNMQNLKLLNLSNVKLNGSYKEFPKSLVWLRWHGFSLNSIPIDLYMEKLVVLDMCNSNLKNVWKGVKFLGELKILNLSHSHGLVRTPNFIGVPGLERLVLKDCINLVEVDESIGNLQRLVSLNLKDCKCLKKLPVEINMLISLEELILSGCSSLNEFPKDLRRLKSLRVLDADGIAINQVVPSKGTRQVGSSLLHSTFSAWLLSKRCAQSASFSFASFPSSLAVLSLAYCGLSDNAIPKDLSCLPSLQVLNLEGNPICCIPESIKSLSKLECLILAWCTMLQSIPELPPTVMNVDFYGCQSLKKIIGLAPEYKSPLKVPIFKLEPVRDSHKEILNNLGLVNLESLENVEVELKNSFMHAEVKTSIQVLYEKGIFNIFLPRSEIPDSFDALQEVGHKVCGLSLSITYAAKGRAGFWPQRHLCVVIKNKTKGLVWSYFPRFYGIPQRNEDILWLSYWMFGDRLEDGDQVQILVYSSLNFQVKKCGIRLIYDQEESGAASHIRELVPAEDHWLLEQLLIGNDRDYIEEYWSRANGSSNSWGSCIDIQIHTIT